MNTSPIAESQSPIADRDGRDLSDINDGSEFLEVERFWESRTSKRLVERAFFYGIALGSGCTVLVALLVTWLLNRFFDR
jgi:hypothetical protein